MNYNMETAEAKITAACTELLTAMHAEGVPVAILTKVEKKMLAALSVAFQQGGHMALHLTKMKLDKHA